MTWPTCTCAKGRWDPDCPLHGRSMRVEDEDQSTPPDDFDGVGLAEDDR